MRFGTFLYVDSQEHIDHLDASMDWLREGGFECCQVNWRVNACMNDQAARKLRQAAQRAGIHLSGVSTFFDGVSRWNVVEGPMTVGLLPADQRPMRLAHVLKTAAFCAQAGVTTLFGHLGYLPTNAFDPNYLGLVASLREIAPRLKALGMRYLFETGQEPAVIFLRILEDVGADNLFINYDPANITMYGFGNPLDALSLYGRYVRGVHVKDGLLPTRGRELGKEMFLGTGRVDWPALLRILVKEYGFDGDLIIERQVDEAQRQADVLLELPILRRLAAQAGV